MTLTCYHRGCCQGYAPFLSFKGLRVSGINQTCKMSEDMGFSMAVAQGRSLSTRMQFFLVPEIKYNVGGGCPSVSPLDLLIRYRQRVRPFWFPP